MQAFWPDFWRGKRVLLTGHTGFKGGWLAIWLHELGAEVTGISLAPNTSPNLFSLANVARRCDSHFCDVRDADAILAHVRNARPEIVFHLAAQPLVRASYREPVQTFSTNVMGTVHLLEAIRRCDTVRVAVMVTTDKVYRNKEWVWPYREEDALGGHDPYSASKAASEIVIDSYRGAFLNDSGVAVATARAGNVIGGGDWSQDRLLPDAARAWHSGRILDIRRPDATRPWQHVLEPLSGYLSLASVLWDQPQQAGAYNFGPLTDDAATVREVIELARLTYPNGEVRYGDGSEGPHEAGWLALEIAKARNSLDFHPRWNLAEAVERTMRWYLAQSRGADAHNLCTAEIVDYQARFDAAVNRYQITDLPLEGLKLVERPIVGDQRGYLSRIFCAEQLTAIGWHKPIAQLNHTYTALRGTIRGMHFQRPPYAEMKLVSCIAGKIFDVAVDLRPDSPTYLKHHVEQLSADNRLALMIPEGFAHGFQSLTDHVQLIYCHSAVYTAEAEDGLNPQDPALGIPWPLQISEISARDSQHALLDEHFEGVIL